MASSSCSKGVPPGLGAARRLGNSTRCIRLVHETITNSVLLELDIYLSLTLYKIFCCIHADGVRYDYRGYTEVRAHA